MLASKNAIPDEMDIVERYASFSRPVDVASLIMELGINYREERMPQGDSGRIVCHDDVDFTIIVNKDEMPQRKRFTAAHELGHYILHRDLLDEHGHLDRLFGESAKRNPDNPFPPYYEVQANQFAADLLMPKNVIRKEYVPLMDNYDELANRFGVSKKAIKIRLKSLGLRMTED